MSNDDPDNKPDMKKRIEFEEIMRKYFPPEQYPHLWIQYDRKD